MAPQVVQTDATDGDDGLQQEGNQNDQPHGGVNVGLQKHNVHNGINQCVLQCVRHIFALIRVEVGDEDGVEGIRCGHKEGDHDNPKHSVGKAIGPQHINK